MMTMMMTMTMTMMMTMMTAVSSGHPMLGTCVLHLSHRGANMQTFLSLEPDDDDDGDDDGDDSSQGQTFKYAYH